ncbi:hypothetical protein [Ruegeria sp. HKCCD9179]|uniref:hypothetical protein n=1 Tax=Ruegeria sp. HKCCD9179 TaxID=2683016 RepID=UPI0014898135|nr:hypothetical protein [Ruegeria sp. HKCCD9179]
MKNPQAKQMDAVAIDALGKPFKRHGPRMAKRMGKLLWAIVQELDFGVNSQICDLFSIFSMRCAPSAK